MRKTIIQFLLVTLLAVFHTAKLGAEPPTSTFDLGLTSYTLTSVIANYQDNSALLVAQPWWGDAGLAYDLMELVRYDLGDLDGSYPVVDEYGIPSALFAYGTIEDYVSITYWGGEPTDCPLGCPRIESDYYYVIATMVQAGYTLTEAYSSLVSTNAAINSALSTTSLLVNGAHSRPMSRRVAKGQKTFWVAGDWGNDNHDSRDGSTGLAEMGFGYNFGPAQINVSLGKTWADQDLNFGGDVDVDGRYLMVEGIFPVSEQQGLYATLGTYHHWGDVDIRRGYLVGGDVETSSANPDTRTWGLRARLDWENAISIKSTRLSPYADVWHTKTKLDGYREKGGSFPSYFESREDDVTELRIGINGALPIRNTAFEFIANVEGVRRFDDKGDGMSGQVVGMFSFDLEGENFDQNWLKGGVGIEGQLSKGKASLMLNGTTEGEAPSSWVAVSYQMAF